MRSIKAVRILVALLAVIVLASGATPYAHAAKQRTIGIISLYLAAAVPPRIGNEAVKL